MTEVVLVVAALAVVVSAVERRRRVGDRVREDRARRDALAPTIDLIAMTVGAGGTPADGVALVARAGPAVVRTAFGKVLAAQRRGDVLVDALPIVTEQLGVDYHAVVTALTANEHGGAPVGTLLQRLAEEADRARSQSIDVALAQLPVRLLLPLVFCQLPAALVGAVLPLTIVALGHLRG